MHVMIQNVLHFYRAESTQTNVKCHLRNIHTLFLYRGKQLFGKMQTGGRCRCRTIILRIDSLITVFILKLVRDIRWKRHLSQLIQNLFKNPIIMELYQPVPLLDHIDHFPHQKSVSKYNPCSGLCLFPGLHQSLPDIVLLPL